MSEEQIQLPPPVGSVAPRPDVVDWVSYEPEIGTDLYEADTVRRLIAEAVAAEREACAALCSEQWQIDGQFTADEFAAAIRARGDKT